MIWVGVHLGSRLAATTAHNASGVILALLKDFGITDVHVHFRESNYTRGIGAPLYAHVDDLDPLVDVIGPLTPALGVRISTVAQPNAQGTMALYLAAGGDSQDLLGLSCRHVLIGSAEANLDYVSHPHVPREDVLHLGIRAYRNVIDSIMLTIARHGIAAKRYRKQIKGFEKRERGTDAADVETARAKRVETEELLAKGDKAMLELSKLLDRVKKDWNDQDNRVIGSIVRSPAYQLGVGRHRFTEDWGLFKIDRSKLGNAFKGNVMDLGAF